MYKRQELQRPPEQTPAEKQAFDNHDEFANKGKAESAFPFDLTDTAPAKEPAPNMGIDKQTAQKHGKTMKSRTNSAEPLTRQALAMIKDAYATTEAMSALFEQMLPDWDADALREMQDNQTTDEWRLSLQLAVDMQNAPNTQ